MTYKSILVHVEPSAASEARIRVAMDLALKFDGIVIGLGAEPIDFFNGDVEFGRSGAYTQLKQEACARLQEAETLFKNATTTLTNRTFWLVAMEPPHQAMALQARAVDLIVADRSQGPDTGILSDLIMETGTPVLVPPSNGADLHAKFIVVGWSDTKECRRALRDALPVLARAKRVFLVQVGEQSAREARKRHLDEIAQRLEVHGIAAETEFLPSSGLSVAKDLEDAADRLGADLIVIGAYGHSRLREWALGGVTRELIEASPRFILFSH